MSNNPFVYIIIVNWNGWKDTIECLESLFKSDYNNYRIIVCDNNSSDGSLEHIKSWADGYTDLYVPICNQLRKTTYPPADKPIAYRELSRKNSESDGEIVDTDCKLVLISTGANLGFAGGNNIGICYALVQNDFDYVWLLNNDTVVEQCTLTNLVDKAVYYESSGSKIGIIASKLMYYANPSTIQSVGGIYNKWFATIKLLGLSVQDNGVYDSEEATDKVDYPIGASMMVAKEFIEDVGLMCEDYFLYFEEMDWVLRGKAKSWQIGYCWQARVFHKEGATIGTSSIGAHKSELSDYYGLKNRIVFTKKFYPNYIWSVKIGFLAVLLNRIRRRQYGRLRLVLSLIFGTPYKAKFIR